MSSPENYNSINQIVGDKKATTFPTMSTMAGTLKYLKLAPDPPPTSRILSWNKKSREININ